MQVLEEIFLSVSLDETFTLFDAVKSELLPNLKNLLLFHCTFH